MKRVCEKNPSVLNSDGTVDVQKLLEASPEELSHFAHENHDKQYDDEGGGTQEVAMPIAMIICALRDAEGLSLSYTPAHSSKVVQKMSASAQHNLGIEAAHGLQMGGSRDSGMNQKRD